MLMLEQELSLDTKVVNAHGSCKIPALFLMLTANFRAKFKETRAASKFLYKSKLKVGFQNYGK